MNAGRDIGMKSSIEEEGLERLGSQGVLVVAERDDREQRRNLKAMMF